MRLSVEGQPMARDIAIRVEDLSKRYEVNPHDRGYATLRETMSEIVTAPFRRFQSLSGRMSENTTFWALQGVSFDVQAGEVVGIIGRNGAGKSTLLKVLSRITEPTTGRVEIAGRVASLLEVGTGFHPELTGRENIFLNGAILGMSRKEIKRKFEEIVAFSDVERFLDTPIKRYSSGMVVRLAFSVAAHLEPEILIVDEVLAVGDQAFQRKCIGKMSGVAKSGRTVLFVSHNMAAVENLCSRAILLERGERVADCEPQQAIAAYSALFSHDLDEPLLGRCDRSGSGALQLKSLQLVNSMSDVANVVAMGEDWVLDLEFAGSGSVSHPIVGIVVTTMTGHRIARVMSTETAGDAPSFERRRSVRIRLKNMNLMPAFYQLIVDLSDQGGATIDRVERAATIEVIPSDVFGLGRVSDGAQSGTHCFFDCEWSFDQQTVVQVG